MSEMISCDPFEGMSADEMRRYKKMGKALRGVRSDRAIALLMTLVGSAVDQSGRPDIWQDIRSGIDEEIRLAKGRLQ